MHYVTPSLVACKLFLLTSFLPDLANNSKYGGARDTKLGSWVDGSSELKHTTAEKRSRTQPRDYHNLWWTQQPSTHGRAHCMCQQTNINESHALTMLKGLLLMPLAQHPYLLCRNLAERRDGGHNGRHTACHGTLRPTFNVCAVSRDLSLLRSIAMG